MKIIRQSHIEKKLPNNQIYKEIKKVDLGSFTTKSNIKTSDIQKILVKNVVKSINSALFDMKEKLGGGI